MDAIDNGFKALAVASGIIAAATVMVLSGCTNATRGDADVLPESSRVDNPPAWSKLPPEPPPTDSNSAPPAPDEYCLDCPKDSGSGGAGASQRPPHHASQPLSESPYAWLLYYIHIGDTDGVRKQLRNNPDLLTAADGTPRTTPLSRAAEFGQMEIVRLLVEAGADIHAKDVLGDRPIDLARRYGHTDIVRYLSR